MSGGGDLSNQPATVNGEGVGRSVHIATSSVKVFTFSSVPPVVK